MQRHFLVALLIGALLLNAGCWSRRELTDVSFTGVLAIDWQDGQYLVSINVLSPRRGGGEGGGSITPSIQTVSEPGASLDEALARIDQMLSRSVTLAHVRSVIFGAEMARRGIGPALDFMLRSVEVRPTVWLSVTTGMARDLIRVRPRQEIALSEGPLGYQDVAKRRSSQSPSIHLTEAANTLQEPGVDLTLPLFRLGNKEPPKPDGWKSVTTEGDLRVVYGGAGVFRGDKLVAWLSPDEARGELWIKGHVVHGAISAQCPTSEHRAVFRLRKAASKQTVQVVQGQPRSELRVKAVADLNEAGCPELDPEEDLEALQQLLAKAVKTDISRALAISRESQSDFMGFGQTLFRRNPSLFRQFEPKWRENLKSMPVTITVEAQVPRTGQMNRRYRPQARERDKEADTSK